MMYRFMNRKHKQTWSQPLRLAVATFAAVIAAGDHAGAASGRNERSAGSLASRIAGEPIIAIISLRNQRLPFYHAQSWILQTPGSRGPEGPRTPPPPSP